MTRTDHPQLGETLWSAVLPNGLPVYVLTKPGFRKYFAAYVANYGGSDRNFTLEGEPRSTPAGVAHYLEHKMFDMPEGDALMQLNATGADPNAFTSMNITAYHFECTSHFEENLRTLLSFVSTPWFTQESVDKERGIIGQELRMYEDDPDFAVYAELMKCLFRDSPLRDTVGGTLDSIARITPQILYDCHKVFYHPSNMCLCVVGDVDPAMVERTALELLPGEPAALPGRDYGPAESLDPVSSYHERRMDVAAPLFSIGLKLGPALTGEAKQRFSLSGSLALRCLCGRSSPFYLKHYADGLLNSTFTASLDASAGQSLLTFDGETPKEPARVLDALREEILRAHKEGFDPGLFERQKRVEIGSRVRMLNSFSAVAFNIVNNVFTGIEPLSTLSLLQSVTLADSEAWAREHLDPDRLAMSVVLPKEF